MNLLADEGVDKQIVVRLREEGYSVSYVAEMAPDISDDIVLELANKEGSLKNNSRVIDHKLSPLLRFSFANRLSEEND
ncbi:MAG: DUF5615 family PIN-like protein [Ignavibacteriaceae bacterium]|nr:DUF5615 family PIN-like protein [Ignavibacteriaceae bacterium]